MMDSPEPSKIKGVSSANATTNTPSSESPQVQESPFLRFVNNLSPIRPVKASHVAHGFLGLSSPPLVFKSPRISGHREVQFLERPEGTHLSSGGISQSDNNHCNVALALGEAHGASEKSNYQQPLSEGFITDTQKDFDIKNDAHTQNCSPTPSVDEYLADPGDIDQMFSVNPDTEQSTDAVESSLSDLTRSKEVVLKFDRKDDLNDKAEEPLPLSGESSMVHQERPAYDEEPEKIEGGKNDVEWSSQEHTTLESNSAADFFDKQYCHDSRPQCAGNDQEHHSDCTPQLMPDPLQDVEECGNCNEMVSTSQVNAENIPQDGSEANLKYHGIRRRCLQFEEAASIALGGNKSHVKLSATSINVKMVPVTGSKPSGIGLHLNSIINAMPPDCAATTGVRLSDGLKGIKSTSSISLHKVDNMTRSLISSNMDGQSFVDTRNESHEIDASVDADCFISKSPSRTEPIASYPASAHDKRSLSPAETGNTEEFNHPSPCKKKKKTSITADASGCKRCNCKKSKCLKLYCDCFAAGIFCGDGCACQGCVNKTEFSERVFETRQQIESRNPLAFAPKIVQCTADVPSNNMEDVTMTTPASARHKRGCNCKRSMCLKKYCECYQANVGCSSGCRCEGCKNAYGKKEDHVALEHALSKERESSSVEKGSDVKMHNKLEMVASKTDLVQATHHLSPLTPLLKCSDQGKEAAKSRLLSGKYLPSTESDVNMLGTASYDSKMVCNNVNVQDQSSPTCDLVANVSGASYRLSGGCIRQISGGYIRLRSSPITPKTNLGEIQHLQGPESDSRLFDILEDETPDVLKEASTPIKSVKANSPIQKRVSPPQSHVIRIGSSSSGGLRSGRKFILQSVPSFPPLTPCVDSKGKCKGNEDSGNSTRK